MKKVLFILLALGFVLSVYSQNETINTKPTKPTKPKPTNNNHSTNQNSVIIIKEIKYNDGAIYKGQTVNGVRQGKGLLIFANGDKYDGDWKDDKRTGKGTYIWVDGRNYVGDWFDGKRHGNGKMRYGSGKMAIQGDCEYEGEWKNDVRDGLGRLTCISVPEWQVFVQRLEKSEIDKDVKRLIIRVLGMYPAPDQRLRETILVAETYTEIKDVIHTEHVGQWKDDQKNGFANVKFSNGDIYDGDYKNNKRQGQGTYFFWVDGSKYIGAWENDMKNGQGILYDKNGKILKSGMWQNGKNTEIEAANWKLNYDYVYWPDKDFGNLIEVRKNGKFGFVDESGRVVIECKYDEIVKRRKNIAFAKKDNKWGAITENGKIFLSFIYDDIYRGGFGDWSIGEFVRVTKLIKPKWIIGENVAGLLHRKTDDGESDVAEVIVKAFEDIGYKMAIPKVLKAEEYGVPQKRRRVFFVGLGFMAGSPGAFWPAFVTLWCLVLRPAAQASCWFWRPGLPPSRGCCSS
jgi:hypothetical protein